jgi:hypothetical protein
MTQLRIVSIAIVRTLILHTSSGELLATLNQQAKLVFAQKSQTDSVSNSQARQKLKHKY